MGKDSKPKPTNGPYAWGNGPQPYGIVKRIVNKLKGK